MQMQELLMPGGMDTDSGAKLYISNLDYGVTNEDIKVVIFFSEVFFKWLVYVWNLKL